MPSPEPFLIFTRKLNELGLRHMVSGGIAAIYPPEYVIVRKLQYFREGGSQKHLRDISRMLLGLGEEWNRDTLVDFIQRHGLSAKWQQALTMGD